VKTVRTAITVDIQTLLQAERLAKKMHISLSRFFTRAAQQMLEKAGSLDLLEKVDAAGENRGDEVELIRNEKTYARKKVIEPW